jgi:hypothetical protein
LLVPPAPAVLFLYRRLSGAIKVISRGTFAPADLKSRKSNNLDWMYPRAQVFLPVCLPAPRKRFAGRGLDRLGFR